MFILIILFYKTNVNDLTPIFKKKADCSPYKMAITENEVLLYKPKES
tara:strand:+ start:4727 stop:4867 length:141 start_codon:yes stop_codon:yes gene_type:complete